METSVIEEIIGHAMGQGGDSAAKAHATVLIDQLRVAPDRWSIGLKLFFEGRVELSRFFGLSLVRDFLATAFSNLAPFDHSHTLICISIRDAVWSWTTSNLAQQTHIPAFILNNLVTVITLLIKMLFPENWVSAFTDLLEVGSGRTAGLDLAVRVICDLEVEVVMFSEGRSKMEVTRNVMIKDAMRSGSSSIVKQMVEFLCKSAASVRVSDADLSERCLRCLAELVGWVDTSLVACESTLSCLYLALRDPELCGAALACLLELAKKGMEPTQKIQMLHAIGLAQVLTQVPIGGNANRGSRDTNDPVDHEEDDEGAEDELGLVVDVYLMELLGCWSKYEEGMFRANQTSSTSSLSSDSNGQMTSAECETQQLREAAPKINSLLRSLLPVALALLNHRDCKCAVAATVVPCLGRLIILFKQQLSNKTLIESVLSTEGGNSNFFLSSDYLNPLLLGIYNQLQFDEDFGYDLNDDDDIEIIEMKKEVRKLFVNCCRIHPEPCLQLISMALSALHQPLSKASFAPLEAALRLVYSFSECGPQFNTLVNEGTFPSLITAIHQTDIASHPHAQVVIAYYEICVRYIRHADSASIRRFVAAMVDSRGLRHSCKQVRCRTAYFLFKTAEAMEGKASTLLSIVGSFADVILSAPDLSVNQQSPSFNSVLTESAELHLLEAIGLITSSTYCYWVGDGSDDKPNDEAAILAKCQLKEAEAQVQKRQRQRTLEEVARLISGHIHSLLAHPQLSSYTDQIAALVAHKISCLSSLAKGHNYKSRAKHPDTAFDAAVAFESASSAVVAAVHSIGHIAAVRGKCIIFHHRMIVCMGLRSLETLGHSVPLLISHSDSRNASCNRETSSTIISEGGNEEVLQLLNQSMLEFQDGAVQLIELCLTPALKKCWSLSTELENTAHVPFSQIPSDPQKKVDASDGRVKTEVEAPHFQAERISLQKQSLVFLQHITTQQCDQALYSDRNSPILTAIFDDELLVGLQGGRGRISKQGGVPLRKAATSALTGLVKSWLSKPTPHPIPSSLSAALWSFLKEKAIPTILRSCTDGTSLDLKDANSLAFLVDVGTFFWTLSTPNCHPEELRSYLSEALPALGWSHGASSALQNMLSAPSPLGTFKESFKKFMKSNVIG